MSREAGDFVNRAVKDARCQIIQLQRTVVSNLNEIKHRFKSEWIGSSLLHPAGSSVNSVFSRTSENSRLYNGGLWENIFET